MTTIDEAIHRLANVKPNVTTRDQFGNSVEHLCVVERDDLRTLLSSYDEMKGRIEEAERERDAAGFHTTIAQCIKGLSEDNDALVTEVARLHRGLEEIANLGEHRAANAPSIAASFVSREKVDGGARG